jgi:hypothetical protein
VTTLGILILIPLILLIILKMVWRDKFEWTTFAIAFLAVCIISSIGFFGSKSLQTRDVEIINGQVTDKYSRKVSCEHDYKCNCTPTYSRDSNGRRYQSGESCQTCYDHSYDVDWTLKTDIGNINIRRVNRQGTEEPQRWTVAKIGDPVADTHSYTNYLKGAEQSLFHKKVEVLNPLPVPEYPSDIYDYHYINRTLAVGLTVPDLPKWNRMISEALREVGPKKQANFVVVIAKTGALNYADKVESAWLGGKKNDVIVVIGAPEYPKIEWVRILSWSDKQDLKVFLRDAIYDIGVVDPEKIVPVMVSETSKRFKRKEMKDFEYLDFESQPPMWASATTLIVSLLVSLGGAIYYTNNQWRYTRRRYR